VKRLEQEAMTLIGAGTETTGSTLSMTTFHLLANPSKLEKLKVELSALQLENATDIMSYRQLESLPYLVACIKECLRLGSAVSGRMPRINRHSPIRYKSYLIPAGTPVSMCQRDLHYSPDIYKNPESFVPERWLNPATRRGLDKYFVPFSKGSRSCVGMNLALAVLHMTIANIFLRFDLELYETTMEDVSMAHDFFAPFGPTDSKGLRVTVG
jgi:cytochrome P450